MLLNNSLQKLIQPFWRHLDFLIGKFMTIWWNDHRRLSLALKAYTAIRIDVSY
jgi:hypothetical protein